MVYILNLVYYYASFKLFFLVCIFLLCKYVWKLRNYSRLVPSKFVEMQLIYRGIGNSLVYRFEETEAFNGYPATTSLLQLLYGLQYLFKKETIFCLWLFHMPLVFLMKPEAVEEVMTDTKWNQKGWFYNWLHCWLGTGLLTSHGEKWKSRRKLLTPAFHFDILKDFLPIINEKSNILVKKWEKETTSDYVNIVTPLGLCSLDIICETTLGINIKAQENSESEYIKAVLRVTDAVAKRFLNIFNWDDFLFFQTTGKQTKTDLKLIHDFTLSVIQEKKKSMLNKTAGNHNGVKRKPLIEVLLEHHINLKDLTDEDIREEVDTFTFEGHDTVSMALTWALYLIGLHEDVQNKIYEELLQIFGDDTERTVTKEDLKDFKYLECVLKESMRLYPSVPYITRVAEKDTTICGYPIPKNMEVAISPFQLHRDESTYPNPEIFDPSRFTPENSASRHPYAYIPFAAGSRNCIGQRFAMMEEKVVVANILRNFVIESLDSRDKVIPSFDLILRPSIPVRVKIRKR